MAVARDSEHWSTRAAANFGASWLSYSMSLVFSHPLDTLRTRWQTRGQTPLQTLRKDTFRSLYCGMWAPLLANGPLVGYVFAVNEFVKAALATQLGVPVTELEMRHVALSGAVAGVSCSLLQSPLSRVRLHQQNSGRAGHVAMSFRQVSSLLYTTEGIRGFYRALPLEAAASGIGRLTYFGTYEACKRWLSARRSPDGRSTAHQPLDLSERVFAAILTSFVGWAAIFPLDLVKNKLQADAISRSAREFQTPGDCVRKTYAAHGVLGFWRGFPLTVTRSVVISAIMLPMFDHLSPRTHRALLNLIHSGSQADVVASDRSNFPYDELTLEI